MAKSLLHSLPAITAAGLVSYFSALPAVSAEPSFTSFGAKPSLMTVLRPKAVSITPMKVNFMRVPGLQLLMERPAILAVGSRLMHTAAGPIAGTILVLMLVILSMNILTVLSLPVHKNFT